MPVYQDISDARQEYIKKHNLIRNMDFMSFAHFIYSNAEYGYEDVYVDYGAFISEIHIKFSGSDPAEIVSDIATVIQENEERMFKEWMKYTDC
jgi:hypothetical protein